jgi:hypothetical protein
MALFVFGDSFNLYATGTDAIGFWDSMSTAPGLATPGRYGGKYLTPGGFGLHYVKSSGQNHPIHKIYVAIRNTSPYSTDAGRETTYLQLNDGLTPLCTIVFQSTGSVRLETGGIGGAQIAIYPNAMTLVNEWYSFDFEVVIHPTDGSFKVRRNANPTDSFVQTGLNTRGAGTNNWANRLSIGYQTNTGGYGLDEILWRSDDVAVPWVGDIRASNIMPNSDIAVQFTRFPTTPIAQTPYSTSSYTSVTIPYALYVPITSTYDGTVSTVGLLSQVAYVGSIKCTVFADAAGAPGAIIASSTGPVTDPPVSNVAPGIPFAFGTPFSVTKDTQYWIGFCFSANSAGSTFWYSNVSAARSSATAYAAFPVASPAVGGLTQPYVISWSVTPTTNNTLVREIPHDNLVTYVTSSTVGHADFYGVPTMSPAPAAIISVTTRAMIQKAGTYSANGRVQLKSGAITVQGNNVPLQETWSTSYRVDTTDPNTGFAWTPGGLAAVQIGPLIT